MTVNVVRKASIKEDTQTVAKGLIKSWKKLLGKNIIKFNIICMQSFFQYLFDFQ